MRTNCTVLIGRKDDVYIFADSVFQHKDGFRGVTGFEVRLVGKAEFKEYTTKKAIVEYLKDSGCYDDKTRKELRDIADQIIFAGEAGSVYFDDSFSCDAESVLRDFDEDFEITDCIACGRIFSGRDDYDVVYNYRAAKAIEAFESGRNTYDYTVREVCAS